MGRVKIKNPRKKQLYLRINKEEAEEIDRLRKKHNYSSRSHYFRTALEFFKKYLIKKR